MKQSDVVIFDGQVFQSTAWDRGMGKYSLNLLAALHKDRTFKGAEVHIMFAKGKELKREAEDTIKLLCPGSVFDFIDLKLPKVVPGEDVRPIERANKKILEKYVSSLGGNMPVFVILSLLIDQYVAAFPDNAKKVLLFYDLIPLQYSDRYGTMWSYPNYLRRFKSIFEADTILTISQTVADDLTVYTGIDPEIIKNIDGAPIDRTRIASNEPQIAGSHSFVLMPSGNDLRKNNFRAIQGFEEFRIASGKEDVRLVVTSYFDEKTQAQLKALSSAVVFTGNVTEEELKWLYENCQALLFVPEYEGLGLPILEAVEFDKPIACSNLTVFNEMSKDAFYYADQHNPSSIASALEDAINGLDFDKKKKHYPRLIKHYTWENTASRASKHLATHDSSKSTAVTHKPKIAVFAPNPAGYSAIGKVVMLTHHALSRYFDIDYYLEQGRSGNEFKRQEFLSSVATTYDSRRFNARDYATYDAVIYHIGNSEYHMDSIKNALHLPGYLIVHDTKLKQAYEDVLVRYAYMDLARLTAEQRLDQMLSTNKTVYMGSLLNASLGAVVHSEYASKALEMPALPVRAPVVKLSLPVSTPELKKINLRTRFAVGFAGIIHKAKGLSIIDQLLASPDFRDVDLYIFGVPMVEPGILERIEAHPNVTIERNLTDFEFETRLSEMDAVVSYRPGYNGETSLTVVEALRHGVVPVVRRIGWFDELPNDVVEKVKTEADVLNALRTLRDDKSLLSKKQTSAKAYAASVHTYKQYAAGLHDLVVSKTQPTRNRKIAKALRDNQSKEAVSKLL